MNKKMYETPEMEIHEIKTSLICSSEIEELAPERPEFDEEFEVIDFNNLKLF